jgi:hypothetical protein
MSMNVKDVIKWLQTLSADDAVYIDMGGPENVYHLFSEMDEDAYLEVGGQHLEMIECLNCHKNNSTDKYKVSNVTGSRVCPECGYEGGRLSPADPAEHQDEWDNLFEDDEDEDDDDSIFEDEGDDEDENFEEINEGDDDEWEYEDEEEEDDWGDEEDDR